MGDGMITDKKRRISILDMIERDRKIAAEMEEEEGCLQELRADLLMARNNNKRVREKELCCGQTPIALVALDMANLLAGSS